MIEVPTWLLPVIYALGFGTPFAIGFLLLRMVVRGR